MTIYYRKTPTQVAHILLDNATTLCGQHATIGARFTSEDLKRAETFGRTCERCRKALRH